MKRFGRSMKTKTLTHHLGGCVITRSLLEGHSRLKWMFREQGCNAADNGWRAIGDGDTQEYIDAPENSVVVDFDRLVGIEPAALAVYPLAAGIEPEFAMDRKIFIDTNTGKEYC